MENVTLSKEQIETFARAIDIKDVRKYIDEHPDDYHQFLIDEVLDKLNEIKDIVKNIKTKSEVIKYLVKETEIEKEVCEEAYDIFSNNIYNDN